MNIYENIRNKKKTVKKLRGYTYKITYTSTANYRRLQNLVPDSSWDIALRPKWLNIRIIEFEYSWIFMNT